MTFTLNLREAYEVIAEAKVGLTTALAFFKEVAISSNLSSGLSDKNN